jgi:carbonic anhydrase
MFVHRNVGNIASADDPNFKAALSFAVQTLRVRHIIVTGHYGCGGVRAAVELSANSIVGHWILPIRRQYEHHRAALERLPEISARCDRLAELHVIGQVGELSKNPVITQAWADGQDITLHGWVYAVRDGLIQPLCRHCAP